jgi:hypothetical protein
MSSSGMDLDSVDRRGSPSRATNFPSSESYLLRILAKPSHLTMEYDRRRSGQNCLVAQRLVIS